MVDFKYLQSGLNALANSHIAGTMAGHLGAAVVTGYFFGEEYPELDEQVYRDVERELDRIIEGEELIWFDVKKTGVMPAELFQPLPKQAATEKVTVNQIAISLNESIEELRQSGHNVIFASIAIRALLDHPELATPEIVRGICKLISAFHRVSGGRGYFGKELGWINAGKVELAAASDFPMYSSIDQMANITIDTLIQTAAIRKQGFGGLWHLINHAAGIAELQRFGFSELALKALKAHHLHVRLWYTLPNLESELGPVQKAKHDPQLPVYWSADLKRDQARLTHRIKTLYGFSTLMRFVEDQSKREKAQAAFRYLLA